MKDEDCVDITMIDADFNPLDPEETYSDVPVYYHCTYDATELPNGALEGGSAAFGITDIVIVQFTDEETPRVIAQYDGLHTCGAFFVVWSSDDRLLWNPMTKTFKKELSWIFPLPQAFNISMPDADRKGLIWIGRFRKDSNPPSIYLMRNTGSDPVLQKYWNGMRTKIIHTSLYGSDCFECIRGYLLAAEVLSVKKHIYKYDAGTVSLIDVIDLGTGDRVLMSEQFLYNEDILTITERVRVTGGVPFDSVTNEAPAWPPIWFDLNNGEIKNFEFKASDLHYRTYNQTEERSTLTWPNAGTPPPCVMHPLSVLDSLYKEGRDETVEFSGPVADISDEINKCYSETRHSDGELAKIPETWRADGTFAASYSGSELGKQIGESYNYSPFRNSSGIKPYPLSDTPRVAWNNIQSIYNAFFPFPCLLSLQMSDEWEEQTLDYSQYRWMSIWPASCTGRSSDQENTPNGIFPAGTYYHNKLTSLVFKDCPFPDVPLCEMSQRKIDRSLRIYSNSEWGNIVERLDESETFEYSHTFWNISKISLARSGEYFLLMMLKQKTTYPANPADPCIVDDPFWVILQAKKDELYEDISTDFKTAYSDYTGQVFPEDDTIKGMFCYTGRID